MTTASQLSKRLKDLETCSEQGKVIFQFPELRNLLKQYYEEGYTDEQASKMASEYYTNKYILGKNRYSDAKIDAAFEKYDTLEMRGF